MIRCGLLIAFVIGLGAPAVASIAPGTATGLLWVSVVEKNQKREPANSVTVYNCPANGCEIAPQGY
jgi:hypothetical protein